MLSHALPSVVHGGNISYVRMYVQATPLEMGPMQFAAGARSMILAGAL